MIKRILLCLITTIAFAQNDYPIVLIHGYLGWGPEEMGDYHYWGGTQDLQGELEKEGYTVFNVSVGPVSSNWERAIETFYQLKGGQVDYGKSHAERWGVIQKPYGKQYAGLYPEWDAEHPVHIIGHSMGGQTARMLLYQLETIVYLDSAETIPDSSFLLGESHNGWVASITSIATPHNGTTLSNIVTRTLPFLQNFIGLAAVVGTKFYNFDLEQWGFERHEDESWISYYERMRNNPAWDTKNISAWDLSINGAQELNTILQADPTVYYFSYTVSATHLDTATGYYVPNDGLNLLLKSKARILGKDVAYWSDGSTTDSTWFENDGVVNTISQRGPTTGLNGPDPIAEFRPDEPLIPGQWYTIGPLKMDHWSVIGQTVIHKEEKARVRALFIEHAKLLKSLPK
ncbi:MAG: lipase [Simkaniaceae bacterium]|nr:lipase [Simkaniaceae bacterium]